MSLNVETAQSSVMKSIAGPTFD